MQLIVLAKSPAPGNVKTRLCPPCTAHEAAMLAEAALADTLAAAQATTAEVVVALDGPIGPWLPSGSRVLPQRGGGLDERLTAAFDDAGGPGVLIGMDTPQVTPSLLEQALGAVEDGSVPFGLAVDGGWWAVGLERPDRRVFLGITPSTPWTGAAQLHRLRRLRMPVVALPVLRDVDVIDDAVAVAAEAPGTRFAAALRQIVEVA